MEHAGVEMRGASALYRPRSALLGSQTLTHMCVTDTEAYIVPDERKINVHLTDRCSGTVDVGTPTVHSVAYGTA